MTAPRQIIYASAPMPVRMSDRWYDLAQPDHFWVRRRFDVLKRLADPLIRRAATRAEFGCGNGAVQWAIENHYNVPVAGFDLNEVPLKQNISRFSPIYCYDIHQRLPEFAGSFDLVLLFDVLEHIDDESRFLQSLKFHMSLRGHMVINVPAHQSLYSGYDRVVGHVRRYGIRHLSL